MGMKEDALALVRRLAALDHAESSRFPLAPLAPHMSAVIHDLHFKNWALHRFNDATEKAHELGWIRAHHRSEISDYPIVEVLVTRSGREAVEQSPAAPVTARTVSVASDAESLALQLLEAEEHRPASSTGTFNVRSIGEHLAELEGWTPRQVNLAIDRLKSMGLVKVQLGSGTNPYKAHGVELNADGLVYAEELRSRGAAKPSGDEAQESASMPTKTDPENGNVFIVHGHDEALKQEVARFVEKLELKAIVLAEQPNKGKTIIEKFEAHAERAGFAIVLLTPDDVGAAVGSEKALKPRARQNVILELGYFVGRLTRSNVCALHVGGVELPSDIHGVLYTPVSGDWKLSLAKEMKAAGLTVDMNKVV